MARMARCFMGLGHEVQIITTEEEGDWFGRLAAEGFEVFHIPLHPLGAIFQARKVGAWLRAREFNLLFLFHAKLAQAALRMLPDDVVVIPTIRLDDPVIYQIGTSSAQFWNAILGNSQLVCERTSAIVGGRPVICIPNGIEQPSPERLKSRRGHGSPLELLYLGRLAEHKGVRQLPSILQECGRRLDCRLRVVGSGEEKPWLERQFSELDLCDRVTFKGVLPPAAVFDQMLDAHVLLLPTLAEGMPNVLLEAQACGCVPVASDLPGITDAAIVDARTGILVPTGDVSAFAESIARLANDAGLWASMSAAGPPWITQTFSMERLRRDYARLVEDSMSGAFPLPTPRRSLLPIDLGLLSWRDIMPARLKDWLRPLCVWRRRQQPQEVRSVGRASQ